MFEHNVILKRLLSSSETNLETNPVIRKQVLNYCGDFLGGIWKKAKPEDISIKKLTGGTINIILLCALSESYLPICNEPTRVVFRIHCNPDTGIVAETVTFSILAQKGLGPKLYGIFDEGRIEEYIPSRPLTIADIGILPIAKEIARQFAHIHQLDIPINKNANFMGFFDEWYQNLSSNLSLPPIFNIPSHYHKYAPKTLTMKDLKHEIEFIRSKLPKLLKNIVFCHNDLIGGNVLLFNENPEPEKMDKNFKPKLMLIDFEFASYNPRGFDLGDHLAEYVFDYDLKEPPYSFPQNVPSNEHMFEFMFAYIEAENPNLSENEMKHKAEELLKETLPFMPIAHLFWSGHMINHGLNNKTDFDFPGYAMERFGLYFMQKHFLEEL
jgi:choline/ethanolamine kinase